MFATADPPKGEISGELDYVKDGVKCAGKLTLWKDVKSLEETDPSPDDLKAEYEKQSAKLSPRGVDGLIELGKWCRGRGLEQEAKKAYQGAIELKPDNLEARRALSFAKTDDGWKPAAEILATKLAALDMKDKPAVLALADWCRTESLFDDEWKLLVALVVADAWDKAAIPKVREIVLKRKPVTPLAPPLAGRWQARVDTTRHHQIKVFAITAIDFVKVDAKGSLFKTDGKTLEDYYAWNDSVTACADGVVTVAEDKFPDMPPGVAGKFEEANFVVIQHTPTESTAYGHLHHGSVSVKAGDKVKKGELIARIGTSGASGLPHLHFTMQTPVWDAAGKGQWIGIPWRFERFRLVDVNGTPCGVDVKLARPQEGWVMEFSGK